MTRNVKLFPKEIYYMKRHSFLSPARRVTLSACKLILITATFLSVTVLARAQSPVDIRISSHSTSFVRLGDGQDIVFNVRIYVEQRRQASGVVVTAELPAGVTFSSAIPSKGTCDYADNLITCRLGEVGMEGAHYIDWVESIRIYARPTQVGTFALVARIIADEPDPNLSNNVTTTETLKATVNPPKVRKRGRITQW